MFQDTPLEVILVNARADEKPRRRGRSRRRGWPAVARPNGPGHVAAAAVGADEIGDAAEESHKQIE